MTTTTRPLAPVPVKTEAVPGGGTKTTFSDGSSSTGGRDTSNRDENVTDLGRYTATSEPAVTEVKVEPAGRSGQWAAFARRGDFWDVLGIFSDEATAQRALRTLVPECAS